MKENGKWRVAKEGEVSEKTSLELFEERLRECATRAQDPREKKELEGFYFLLGKTEKEAEKEAEGKIMEKGGKITKKMHPKAIVILSKKRFWEDGSLRLKECH